MFSVQKFGKIARDKRERKGMSLERTAELCGLSVQGLELIELGDSNPKLSSVLSIASVLGIDLGELNDFDQTAS